MRFFRASIRVFTVMAVLAACTGLIAPAALASSSDPSIRLLELLSGAYQGTTPGNELRINMSSIATFDMSARTVFARTTGTYQGVPAHLQGVMSIETYGNSVLVTYVPRFDIAASVSSVGVTAPTEEEANAACRFDLKPRGDGFVGVTSGSCAFAVRGAIGKWSIEVEPGSMRLRNVKTGETLRFKRVSN